MSKKVLIFWGVAMASLTVYLLNKFGKKSNNVEPATSYDTIKQGKVIITKPNSGSNIFNIIYVFGGMDYANKEWMKEQMPKSYFLNNIVVLANYTNTFSYAKSQLEAFLAQNGLNKGEVSIVGFSAGGLNVANSYNKDFKFVGLIDPSNKSEHKNIDFAKNTFMVFNTANWGAYPRIKADMKVIAENVVKGGGYANSTSMKHREIPKFFFINFSDIHRIKN